MNAKRILPATAVAAAALVFGQAATAADGVWKVGNSYVVRYEALDLATVEGRAGLLDMIETAARRLCRGQASKRARDACFSDTVAAATVSASAQAREALVQAAAERGDQGLAAR
jgi:UrcA family protein